MGRGAFDLATISQAVWSNCGIGSQQPDDDCIHISAGNALCDGLQGHALSIAGGDIRSRCRQWMSQSSHA